MSPLSSGSDCKTGGAEVKEKFSLEQRRFVTLKSRAGVWALEAERGMEAGRGVGITLAFRYSKLWISIYTR